MPYIYRPTVTRRRPDGTRHRTKTRGYWIAYRNNQGRLIRRALKAPNGQPITRKDAAQVQLAEVIRQLELGADQAQPTSLTSWTSYTSSLEQRGLRPSYVSCVTRCLRRLLETPTGSSRVSPSSLRLAVQVANDQSAGTRVQYRRILSGYMNWLVDRGELPKSFLETLPPIPKGGGVKRQRRALTREEAVQLLAASKNRALIYETALGTGLRFHELGQLEWSHLRDGCLHVPGTITKNRQPVVIPLPLGLSQKLEAVRDTGRIFKSVPEIGQFYRDLKRAGIEKVVDGRYVDRHALRTTYITWLIAGGASPLVVQRLARHADIRLTLGIYTDEGLLPLKQAVAGLPSLELTKGH